MRREDSGCRSETGMHSGVSRQRGVDLKPLSGNYICGNQADSGHSDPEVGREVGVDVATQNRADDVEHAEHGQVRCVVVRK